MPVTLKTRDGRRVKVRSIRPDDAERLVDLFWHLSPETRFRRFFVPLEHVDPDLVQQTARRLVVTDPQRELALVGIIPEQGHEVIIAVARFATMQASDTVAEASLVVRDDYHGVGLGYQLLDLLVQAAVKRGLQRLVMLTQGDNMATLALVKHLGLPYTCTYDDGLCEITLVL